jgi:ElaB/YqjD/DUF883 family membrane-anchored ribosome-binding protein
MHSTFHLNFHKAAFMTCVPSLRAITSVTNTLRLFQKKLPWKTLFLSGMVGSFIVGSGCSKAYFSVMEKLGYPKRSLMISSVEDAQKSQQAAKEEFKDALESYRAVLNVKGAKLEEKYKLLRGQLESCEGRARDVSKRISSVEQVSDALLSEWEKEIGQYSNQQFAEASKSQLREAKTKANALISAMKRAESRLNPALQPLRDNVLFLKHNLNARAIAGLNDERIEIEDSVSTLITDLERAISEADRFIADMNKEQMEQ